MERLNDIMGRVTQQRQLREKRLAQNADSQSQGTRPGQPPQSLSRRPMPEQAGYTGQRYLYGSQRHSVSSPMSGARHLQGQGEFPLVERREGHTYHPDARPIYPRQRPAPNGVAPYQQQRTRPPQENAYAPYPSLPSEAVNNYPYTDDYGPSVPADVVDEWDDDASGMLYGDWEKDDDKLPRHQQPETEIVAEPHTYYAPIAREMLRSEDFVSPTHMARNLRDVRMPATTQSVPHSRRITQSLNPQAIAALSRERDILQEARNIRQFVPPEQAKPVVAIAPLPTSQQKKLCPQCQGAGYLRADVPFGHPNFGKPIACTCKEAERKEKRRQQLRSMSNLDAFRSNSFGTFNSHIPGVREAYQDASAYACNPDGWLLLLGPNGCGKTHLAVAIAKQCLDNGSVALFSVVPDLLDHLRAAFAPNATEVYDQLFTKMREAEVLVLDDLGTQQSSTWANEKLFQLLNYRYNMGMPTVITANPRGLQAIDERIRSRLSDNSLVITVNFDHARDYRPNHPR